MSASEIRIERPRPGVAVVSIDRPARRNACDFAAWSDLRQAFLDLAADRSMRLAVLTGSGGHFCAGDDIVAFAAVRADAARAQAWRQRIQQCYAAVQEAPFPVLAAISGACVGGGCSLAMVCDFRIADRSARIGVPVARLGLVYPTIQLQRLAWLIGASNARRWIYEAGIYGVDEAHRVGFVDRLADADVVEEALRFGSEMTQAAPLSIAGSKAQLNAILAAQVESRRAELDALVDRADRSDDAGEAARAFAEKRKPDFSGR